MDTERLKAILRGERSGDLDEAESLAFEALLRDPAALEALARAEEELATLAVRFEPPELPATAWARVDAAVKAEARLPIANPIRRWRSAPVWLAAAASVLLVVGIGVGKIPHGTDTSTNPGTPSIMLPGTIVPSPTPPPVAVAGQPPAPALRPGIVEVVHGDEGLEYDQTKFEASVFPITFGDDTLVSISVRDRTPHEVH